MNGFSCFSCNFPVFLLLSVHAFSFSFSFLSHSLSRGEEGVKRRRRGGCHGGREEGRKGGRRCVSVRRDAWWLEDERGFVALLDSIGPLVCPCFVLACQSPSICV